MKNIKSYDEFNEELNIKNALIGGAIGTALTVGAYQAYKTHDKASLDKVQDLSGEKFKKYNLYANGEIFELYESNDGVITSIWDTEEGNGKDEHTVTHTCVTVPEGMNDVWYDTKFCWTVYVSGKKFPGAKHINISSLSIDENTDTYTIYDGKFFSAIDYIIVNKGHKSGEEFTLSDDKMNKYICDEISSDIYIFCPKGLGGGDCGGAGAGSSF